MSYDLHVYAAHAADGALLRTLIDGSTQLSLADFDEGRGWYTVARGAKRRYCFTIDGPMRLEPDDVPDEVTAAMLGAAHLFHITVEGSATADIPHAIRFGRRLAQELSGVVVDQQTDELWSKAALRRAAKPARDERVNEIRISWYCRFSSVPSDWPDTYLSLCRRLLPEALPRRFGEYEPLQKALDTVGDAGFVDAWRQATSLLFFDASAPCISGSVWAGPNEQHPRHIWHMGLDFHYAPLVEEPRWCEAAQRLFIAVAQTLRADFASAEVTRGSLWNGRRMAVDGDTESRITPARRQGWMGLPPYPTWWAWYGEPYRPLVAGRLTGGEVIDQGEGLFHRLCELPANRDELTELVGQRRGRGPEGQWAPPELVAEIAPNPRDEQPTPLRAAHHIPSELRGPSGPAGAGSLGPSL